MDFSQTTFKDHLRAHCKPAYQRQNKGHYKDNPEINSGQVLLTVMQVFCNATDFSPETSSGSKTV